MGIRIPLGGGGSAAWERGRPKDGGFSIEMPGGVKSRKIPLFKYKDKKYGKVPSYLQVFNGQFGDTASAGVMVSYTYMPYPGGTLDELPERLDRLFKQTIKAMRKVRDVEEIQLGGYPGRRFRAENGSYISEIRMFTFPKLFISLTFAHESTATEIPVGPMARFFDSLQVDESVAPTITVAHPVAAPAVHPAGGAPVTASQPLSSAASTPAPAPGKQAPAVRPPGPRRMPPPRAVPPAGPKLLESPKLDQSALVGLLTEKGIATKTTDDGYVLVEGEQSFCYVWPTEGNLAIQLFTPFSFTAEADETVKLRYVNQVNQQLSGLRATVAADGSLSFDRSIPVQGGISFDAVASCTRGFLQGVRDALTLDHESAVYLG